MKQLINIITHLTEFGVKSDINKKNIEQELLILLVDLYSIYLKDSQRDYSPSDSKKEPDFDYDEIRKHVVINFPSLSYYKTVMNPNEIYKEAEIGMGDAHDDLADIVKDMMLVKWNFENNGENAGWWEFIFNMKFHSEKHLVDLVKYIKDRED